MGEESKMYVVLVGKLEGKRPLGRRVGGRVRSEWILREIGCGGVEWIHLAQNREWWLIVVTFTPLLRI
jgi:hypothetical protein